MMIKNWKDAHNYLLTRACVDTANTSLCRMPFGEIRVMFYDTAIVTYHQDGRVLLNSGGFRTPTTKSRINQFTDILVFARDYAWFVRAGSGLELPFTDGMNVGSPDNAFLGRMKVVPLPL